ncbi:MAG TPA: protein kinase [Gemmatimonadales bacterium]|nr:protein kinase [Gemmatimonadales bacterium]
MPTPVEELGALFAPRYRIIREVGGGTAASVWVAEDTRHGREVAIKVLRKEYSAGFAAERFLQEIEIAARLQHPHIVPLLDSGEAGGHLYLVMPFVEGESLRQRLVREGRLPVADVIRIMSDVADALAYAHAKGVVHRDIKPDNILLAGRHALVTDFGVARAVSAATVEPRSLTGAVALGTPAYMAPEQAMAEQDIDPRADVYALGVVGYELLTGTPPFEGPTIQAVLTAHVLDAPTPVLEKRAETPAALAALTERCLAKARDERFATAEEVVRLLEPMATPSGGSTPASVMPVAPRASLLWPVVALVALVALAIAGYLARPRPAIAGFTEKQLTFTGSVHSSAISPDGQFLAFVADSAGSAYLMLQETRGGRAITLAHAGRMGHVTWSGDGAEIRAYAFDAGAVYIQTVPRLGGPVKLVKVSPWSVPSPDGNRVFDLPQGGLKMRVRNLATGAAISAPLEPGWWFSPPAWSADGRWVAAAAFRETGAGARLVVISAEDLRVAATLEDSVAIGTPAWDGRRHALFYLRGATGLMDLYRLELSGKGTIASAPVLVRAGLAVGSPDVDISFPGPVSVSADGTQLVYTLRHEWSNLAAVAFDDWSRGGSPTPLTAGSATYGLGRLSPDGRFFAAIRNETDGGTLQILPVGPGQALDLGRFPEGLGVSWSPDGKRVLAGILTPDSGIGVRIYTLADLTAQTRFYGGAGATPEWIDDTTLVAPRPGNRSLQILSLGSGAPRPLPGVNDTGWTLWPRRSPDGHSLVFAWNRGNGRQGLDVVDLRDGRGRQILAGIAKPLGWSQDGRLVFAARSTYLDDSVEVVGIPVDGGPVRALAHFPPDLDVLEVTPDGRRALLNMHGHQADTWLMHLSR